MLFRSVLQFPRDVCTSVYQKRYMKNMLELLIAEIFHLSPSWIHTTVPSARRYLATINIMRISKLLQSRLQRTTALSSRSCALIASCLQATQKNLPLVVSCDLPVSSAAAFLAVSKLVTHRRLTWLKRLESCWFQL